MHDTVILEEIWSGAGRDLVHDTVIMEEIWRGAGKDGPVHVTVILK
jgi:hypothetical protein